MANYSIQNFVGLPNPTDTRLKIYDKSARLKYIVDPNVAYFFAKSNVINIKVENKNQIQLDFATSQEAIDALIKLNNYKKIITDKDVIPTPPPFQGSVFSKSNLNMSALDTVNDGDLATLLGIIDNPLEGNFVRVTVNGLEVNVGGKVYPYDCYFSNDNGITAKSIGEEQTGDKLYWNTSIAGYNLDSSYDKIDFIYLIRN